MSESGEITSIEGLLNRLKKAGGDGDVSVGAMMETLGSRSFGPLLALAGIVTVSPLNAIPVMAGAMGALVAITSAQILFRRPHVWLPQWLLTRSVGREKMDKTVKWLLPPGRVIDRLLRRRIALLTHRWGLYVVAALSVVIGAGMPFLDIVPFGAMVGGAALLLFGLGLMAHDGLVLLTGLLLTAGAVGAALFKVI